MFSRIWELTVSLLKYGRGNKGPNAISLWIELFRRNLFAPAKVANHSKLSSADENTRPATEYSLFTKAKRYKQLYFVAYRLTFFRCFRGGFRKRFYGWDNIQYFRFHPTKKYKLLFYLLGILVFVKHFFHAVKEMLLLMNIILFTKMLLSSKFSLFVNNSFYQEC